VLTCVHLVASDFLNRRCTCVLLFFACLCFCVLLFILCDVQSVSVGLARGSRVAARQQPVVAANQPMLTAVQRERLHNQNAQHTTHTHTHRALAYLGPAGTSASSRSGHGCTCQTHTIATNNTAHMNPLSQWEPKLKHENADAKPKRALR